ncbi:MAG: thioesterase family protein [Acidobacteria bacterium]|nr:thioesterase family protein [Acidobacteriota bacterium]
MQSETSTEQTAQLSELTDAYYESLGGGRYRSTIHAQGAWDPREQHMAAVTGIMVRELRMFRPDGDLRMARFSFDILGQIPGGEFQIETRVLRPGRTIELVEATLSAGGRTAVRASAWRLQLTDTSAIAAGEDERIPGPEESEEFDGLGLWPGGYIASLGGRVASGHRAGNGCVWLKNSLEMVSGEKTDDVVRLLGMVDAANGIAPREKTGPGGFMFPNVDLQIHLYRQPVGEWLGLDNSVTFGADGVGLTSSVLHDVQGPFGRAEQILTIRAL